MPFHDGVPYGTDLKPICWKSLWRVFTLDHLWKTIVFNHIATMAEKPAYLDIHGVDSGKNESISDSPQPTTVQLENHGLPLVPTPSSDPLDPLNWRIELKVLVLSQVSILSFLALLSASLIVSIPKRKQATEDPANATTVPDRRQLSNHSQSSCTGI